MKFLILARGLSKFLLCTESIASGGKGNVHSRSGNKQINFVFLLNLTTGRQQGSCSTFMSVIFQGSVKRKINSIRNDFPNSYLNSKVLKLLLKYYVAEFFFLRQRETGFVWHEK